MNHKLNLAGVKAGQIARFWCGINVLPAGDRAVRRWNRTDCDRCWEAYVKRRERRAA
jgi:hypothetical protein